MGKSTVKDMTVGSPLKLIIGFAFPMFLGNLFQQFYSIIDTMIVGKFLGVEALAGVGATGSISFLIIGLCLGICSGFSIPIAQTFGAKDYVNLRKYVANSIYLSAAFAVSITLVVTFLCDNILRMMNTPDNIFEYSYIYILIIFFGIPATFLYNILSGIIRSLGDSRTPLLFLLLSSFINIIFDLLFIIVFHMGVAGASVATVLSQLISGLLCLAYLIKKFEILHIKGDEWKVEPAYMTKLVSMGLPMGLQYSITAIGSVVLQTSVNTLGAVYVASSTAGGKVSLLFCSVFDALGSTMATYAGQNIGAKKIDRIGRGLVGASLVGIGMAIFSFIVIFNFGDKFALLFVSGSETEILMNSRMFLIANSAAYILLVFVNNIRFLIQGMGFSTLAILSGVFEMIARIIAGLFLVPALGYLGACLASPLAWLLADAFLFTAYFKIMKKVRIIMGVSADGKK